MREKKLNKEIRRWRGPVVQAVAENVLRQWRSGKRQSGFNRRWFDDTEIGSRRYPPNRISIKVLPFGFDRSAVNSSYSVRGRIGGSPKTSRETEGQRANGNDDQRTTPSPLTNATMPQQLHLAATSRSFTNYTSSG